MSIVVIVNFTAKEESIEDLKSYFKKILPDTRSYEGCEGVQLYQDMDSPTKFTIQAKWTSKEAQQKYISWRMESGEFEKLGSMITDSFSMDYYDIIDE